MEIRSTSADDPNSAQRIDLTRKNREAIQTRQPLNKKPDETPGPRDPIAHAKAVFEAREEHRELHQQRIAHQREKYTKNHADEFAQSIEHARDVYNARMDKAIARRIERSEAHSTEATGDKLELSSASEQVAPQTAGAGDAARAQLVDELKKLYQSGQLDSDDLISRAAFSLLRKQ